MTPCLQNVVFIFLYSYWFYQWPGFLGFVNRNKSFRYWCHFRKTVSGNRFITCTWSDKTAYENVTWCLFSKNFSVVFVSFPVRSLFLMMILLLVLLLSWLILILRFKIITQIQTRTNFGRLLVFCKIPSIDFCDFSNLRNT